MLPRVNRIQRYTPVLPIDPVYPLYPFREEPALPERPSFPVRNPVRDERRLAQSSPLRSAAEAAGTVVRQAIEVRDAADRASRAPTDASMLELQAKAERFRARLASETALRLDANLAQRLNDARTPSDWRRIAEPFAAEPPRHLLPADAGIYTAAQQLRSLHPGTGMIVAEQI
ncbi:hypothetical protein [Cohnella nanjingensis]|uniref:Uncharacterized protein n=1 Tax=Cohnella nanjingensis TaxID=1387779 RepID=A0A7X0VII1_9BACL|nr:hypothetical protein [Cohnella nanjingensis]MBB6674981.1 hypothetical protein [Cohnella nanjingensis]